MHRIKLSKSIRAYIRSQKAKIRREVFNPAEIEQKIKELLAKYYHEIKMKTKD